ncbi:hypothetical protein V1477_010368 [Vespula maculifrons]|uniref:Uncharacterized protein n=1 Tax=Vespula maculifrons TaxID=7453 RepID=A0ABD2C8C1_VESMC
MGSRRKILFFSQTRSSPSKLFATIDSDIGFSLHRNSPVGAAFALDSCPCRSKTQSYSGTLPNRRSKCAQPTRSGNTLPVIAGGSILPRSFRANMLVDETKGNATQLLEQRDSTRINVAVLVTLDEDLSVRDYRA